MRVRALSFLLLLAWAHGAVATAGEPPGHEAPPRQEHRMPKEWTFTLPQGNSHAGREVFIAMECYKCHAVQGEQFPGTPADVGGVGPELTDMGAMHPPEYFAESIIAPNAVLTEGPGSVGADGRSRMPTYNQILTIEQLLDLVAYLKSLVGQPTTPHGPGH